MNDCELNPDKLATGTINDPGAQPVRPQPPERGTRDGSTWENSLHNAANRQHQMPPTPTGKPYQNSAVANQNIFGHKFLTVDAKPHAISQPLDPIWVVTGIILVSLYILTGPQ